MRRLLGAAAAIALAISGGLATSAHAAPRARTVAPRVDWVKCTDPSLVARRAECGFVTVPMSYADPDVGTVKLAISRIRHTVPASRYQGVMLVNPGGPGARGRGLAVLGALVPKKAGLAYDWIGFDPRGVGDSVPSLSCDADYIGYNRPEYVPTSSARSKVWLARAERYAQRCAKAGGDLLDHLRTRDSARDMDNIRAALGVQQINFYGFSYGTYLGQVYATMFPSHVRRMVLDGNVNPHRIWYRSNLDQDLAFDRNINIYFAWLAKYDAVYHLGRTGPAVRKLYYAEAEKLGRKPAAGVIGSSELTDIFLQAGYYVFGWEDIAQAFSAWVTKRDAGPLRKLYDKNNPQTAGADNAYAIYLGVQCTDMKWPDSWSKWAEDNWSVHRKAPFETWANAWFNAPCRDWEGRSGEPTEVDGDDVPPVLLISETLDAATPFTGSLEVRKLFPRASLVEGMNGTTHAGSLFGNPCVDNTVADYLATGALPKRLSGERSDRRCPAIPQPNPIVSRMAARQKAQKAMGNERLVLQQEIIGR
jgi:pimeloyl-ACP methyl ester carboxylesterase